MQEGNIIIFEWYLPLLISDLLFGKATIMLSDTSITLNTKLIWFWLDLWRYW